tara:strand:- start:965 stop:1486 length:522 start_codon:yes stop_codon:yes gene_type:complete
MSKSATLLQDKWSTTQDHKVSVASKMREDGNHKTFNRKFVQCFLPPKELVLDILATCSNKSGVFKDGDKYCLTPGKWTYLAKQIESGMDIPVSSELEKNLNRFVNRHVGRFASKYGKSEENVIDFVEGLVMVLNNYREQYLRLNSADTVEKPARKQPVGKPKTPEQILNRIMQ